MDEAFASKLKDIVAGAKPTPQLRTCLYVEDSYANLLLVQQLIARHGEVKLLSANTGPIGIQMAKDFHPDIIFMDINLPGMSGVEALEILKADPADRKHSGHGVVFQCLCGPDRRGAAERVFPLHHEAFQTGRIHCRS